MAPLAFAAVRTLSFSVVRYLAYCVDIVDKDRSPPDVAYDIGRVLVALRSCWVVKKTLQVPARRVRF